MVTRGPPPNPAAMTRSGTPSPFTSPTAGRMPPRNVSSAAPPEVGQPVEVGHLGRGAGPPGQARPVVHDDLRPAPLVRGDDHVGLAVPGEVPGGDEHPAGEPVLERLEVGQGRPGLPVDDDHPGLHAPGPVPPM